LRALTPVNSDSERWPALNYLIRLQEPRQHQADGAGVDEVIEPSQLPPHRDCGGEQRGVDPGRCYFLSRSLAVAPL
jgi:hypothetical protein